MLFRPILRRLLGKQSPPESTPARDADPAPMPTPTQTLVPSKLEPSQTLPGPPQELKLVPSPSASDCDIVGTVPTPSRSNKERKRSITAHDRSRSRSRSRSRCSSRAVASSLQADESISHRVLPTQSTDAPEEMPTKFEASPPSPDPTHVLSGDPQLAPATPEQAPATPVQAPTTPVQAPAAAPQTPPRKSARRTWSSYGRMSMGQGRCRRSLARRASAATSEAHSRASFAHRDFENSEAETCWLSCLFQTLWHSRVFHTAFEQHLAHGQHWPAEHEKIIQALQQTWQEYRATGSSDGVDKTLTFDEKAMQGPCSSSSGGTTNLSGNQGQPLVSPDELVSAFGDGYGDMSEALAMLVDELSQCGKPAIMQLAESLLMVPVVCIPGSTQPDADGTSVPSLPSASIPTPSSTWPMVQEWGGAFSPLIAIDLSLPQPNQALIESLCAAWIPKSPLQPAATTTSLEMQTAVAPSANDTLGPDHQFVALVCFMHEIQHYVAFCRRQSGQCVYFNDLPDLTPSVDKFLNWSDVPSLCGMWNMAPRLVFYEVRSESDNTLAS